jgi:thymidine kinase
MFSGKTTWLNNTLNNIAEVSNLKCLKIIHGADNREAKDNNGSTHNIAYSTMSSKLDIVKLERLEDLPNPSDYNTIGIDESQLFPDLYKMVKYWVKDLNINVKVAGLSGDYKMERWGDTTDLIPIATDYKILRAKCHICLSENMLSYNNDTSDAPFTMRIAGGNEQIAIGGIESYKATCLKHHIIYNMPITTSDEQVLGVNCDST